MKKLIFKGLAFMSLFCVAGQVNAKDSFFSLPEFTSGKPIWTVKAGIGFNGVIGSANETSEAIWDSRKYEGEFKYNTAFHVQVGFDKSFGRSPFYWGMNLAFGQRGYNTDAYFEHDNTNSSLAPTLTRMTEKLNQSTYNVQLSPFTFGYKCIFAKKMALDMHLGVFASYDFAGNSKFSKVRTVNYFGKYPNQREETSYKTKLKDFEDYRCFGAGVNLGLGYWFGPFNLDFTWQFGGIPMNDNGDDEIQVGNSKKNKREVGNRFSNNFLLTLGFAF